MARQPLTVGQEERRKVYAVKQTQKMGTVLSPSLIFWSIHSSLGTFVLLQGYTRMVKLSISLR